jgi:hypothetical protein
MSVNSQPYLTATVVYEYVWKVDDRSKQTSTYTTTYIDSPGDHTAYALVVNTALPSSLQIETVGIPYTIVPGEITTQHASATVATHRPTTPLLQANRALVTSATSLSVLASASSKAPCHGNLSGPMLSLYLTYLQVILACLVLGGYCRFRYLRHLRSQDDGLEKGQGAVLSLGKPASDKSTGLAEHKSQDG